MLHIGYEERTTKHDRQTDPHPKPGVLIVSHHATVRTMFAQVLAIEGYWSQQAADGEEGLRLLRQATDCRRRCLVLLQFDPYPDMEALWETLHEQPQLHARHRIIAFGDMVYLEVARAMGADDGLAMPFTVDQVVDVVERNAAALGLSQPL